MNAFERYAPFIQDYIYASGWKVLRGVQNAAAQAQQALTPAQKILLAGQIAALPQCRAVDRHADVGRVVRQADKQIVLQRTAALGVGAQQVVEVLKSVYLR